MLLPLVFVIVAALFAALAQRMAREMTHRAAALGVYHQSAWEPRRRRGFALLSWLELPPTVWFGVAFAARAPAAAAIDPGGRGAAMPTRRAPSRNVALARRLARAGARARAWVAVVARTTGSRSSERGEDTVIDVNNVFHQSMAPLEHKEYFYEWPYRALPGKFDEVLVLGAGSGHRRRRRAAPRRHACRRGRDRPDDSAPRPCSIIRTGRTRIRGSR